MRVPKGSKDVTTYFQFETGLTITLFDLQYTRTRSTPATKVDATALGAANSAHADNKMIEVDATTSPGLYRVDWPDAAFAKGVDEVMLTVNFVDGGPVENLRVELTNDRIESVYLDFTSGAGDDGNRGGIEDPLRTLAEANSRLSSGTAKGGIIYVMSDIATYAEGLITLGENVSLVGLGSLKKLETAASADVLQFNNSTIKNMHIRNYGSGKAIDLSNNGIVTFEDCEISGGIDWGTPPTVTIAKFIRTRIETLDTVTAHAVRFYGCDILDTGTSTFDDIDEMSLSNCMFAGHIDITNANPLVEFLNVSCDNLTVIASTIGKFLGNIVGTITNNSGTFDITNLKDVPGIKTATDQLSFTSGNVDSNAKAISDSTAAADNVEANIGNLDAAVSDVKTATDQMNFTAGNIDANMKAISDSTSAADDLEASVADIELTAKLLNLDIEYDFVSTPAKMYLNTIGTSTHEYTFEVYTEAGTKPTTSAEIAIRRNFA